MQVMRRWLDIGVDGFRLDAIPYLCEREGTNNENLPETHAIIKKIRAELDAYAPGKLLLAEANQWPEDVSAYFGDGDECHMAYHFPLMPRIYMAIAQEDRFPIADILRQTPDIPGELPVGAVPAQPRRAHARNGDRRRARLSVVDLRHRSARAHQSRHPPPPRAADGQRPAQDRADELAADVAARHADHLLRRRDRHGRQHLSRRPQRRAHADAMDARPQRRLFALRSGPALCADDHGPGLRLPGGQRRGAVAQPRLAAELDQAPDRGAQVEQGVRPRLADLHPARPTARCWPMCASIRTRSSSASPTCRARRRRPRSISRRGAAACRSRCSAARISRRSAIGLIVVTLAPYGFFWFQLCETARDDARSAQHRAGTRDAGRHRRLALAAAGPLAGRSSNATCCRASCRRAAGSPNAAARADRTPDRGGDPAEGRRSRHRAGAGRSQGPARDGHAICCR